MSQLKYLFECHFKDGSMLQQTPEDVSRVEPTRSAFYDVDQRLDDVLIFGLFSQDRTAIVDLRDGHFEINGVPFLAGDSRVAFPPDTVFRLVYFRRVTRDFTLGLEEIGHYIEYHIGWQTTIDGKNYQQTIALN